MEGEERDAQRQLDVGPDDVGAERLDKSSKISGDEIGVFEDSEHEKIDGDRDAKRGLARRAIPPVDRNRRGVVENDGEQQDRQKARITPGVENEGEDERDNVFAGDGRGQEIAGDENRQKVEQERDRRKYHTRIAFASRARGTNRGPRSNSWRNRRRPALQATL